MIKIYSPNDEFELSMIRGVFDTENINYFIHNDHFGSSQHATEAASLTLTAQRQPVRQ
jgi:hypothetical protein